MDPLAFLSRPETGRNTALKQWQSMLPQRRREFVFSSTWGASVWLFAGRFKTIERDPNEHWNGESVKRIAIPGCYSELDRRLLGRLFGGDSSEVAGDTIGIDIHVAGDF